MALSLVTPPATEPITLEETLDHLRLAQDTADSDLVDTLITAAREHAETVTGRQFLTATWELTLDAFPCWRRAPIHLPLPPLSSVTSVTYLDTAGATQTWAAGQYVVDSPGGPRCLEGRIYPALDVDYPDTAARQDAVTIRYIAGYGTAADVPRPIKQAMLLLVGHWYEQREATIVGPAMTEVPLAVEALLMPFSRLSEAVR